MSHLPWDGAGRIEAMSGAFCMLRRAALDRVGLLDEDFFMYGEDIDLSYRLLKGGYENWYVPARIVHYKGESTQKSSFRYVHVFYQAMLIFFRKHYSHASWLVALPIKAGIYLKALLALVQMGCNNVRQSLGFVSADADQPEYVFVGSAAMLEECRHLARRKGLSATFTSQGASRVASDKERGKVCMVYDGDTFSFDQIIDMAVTNSPALLGTYSQKTKTLITPTEIIR